MMSFSLIPAYTTYASQRLDRPTDPVVEFNREGLPRDTYYNCELLGRFHGVCLNAVVTDIPLHRPWTRVLETSSMSTACITASYWKKVDGLFVAVGPANNSLFWSSMHYCQGTGLLRTVLFTGSN